MKRMTRLIDMFIGFSKDCGTRNRRQVYEWPDLQQLSIDEVIAYEPPIVGYRRTASVPG